MAARQSETPFQGALQAVEKLITEQPVQSNPATCAADLVFLKRKRRKNNTNSQDCAQRTGTVAHTRRFRQRRANPSDSSPGWSRPSVERLLLENREILSNPQFSPSAMKIADFHCKCQKVFFDTQKRPFKGRFLCPFAGGACAGIPTSIRPIHLTVSSLR